ncbi:MAG: cupin-like domain-containing protein [Pseudomonadales bacterium]
MSYIEEIQGCRPDSIDEAILTSARPLVLRGLVADWPIVSEGNKSAAHALEYLQSFYSGAPLTAYLGGEENKGRVFYNEDLTGFNFDRARLTLTDVIARLLHHLDDPSPPTIYVGSTLVDNWLPGFRGENDLSLGLREPLVSVWIGNQSVVPAHYDFPENIACAVLGRRRFTVFPPDQLDNLYIGPLDFTPSGQPISLVDFRNPDFEKFPKFRQALDAAIIIDLEPGDALFLPGMWWHHVEALDSVNILVNYWWRSSPSYMGAPLDVLKHALLGLRNLSPEQRKAWQHIFDYYVFNPGDEALSHIPEQTRGILSGVDDTAARKLRAQLLNNLNQ